METAAIQSGHPLVEEKSSTKDNYVKVYNLTFVDKWYFYFPPNLVNPLYQYEYKEVVQLPLRLTNPLYGREELDEWINDKAKNAPSIEKIWEITARLPSLTKMLLEDRNNE